MSPPTDGVLSAARPARPAPPWPGYVRASLAWHAGAATFALLASAKVPALAAVGWTVAPGALLSLLLAAAFSRPTPGRAPRGPVPQ